MEQPCYLCKSSENDELLYGKIYKKYKLSVHYYCLLLSSNLVQNGANDEIGIFGFLPADIRKENERTKSCRCYICKQMHANVFCCAKKCLRTFHTVCGIKHGCLSHFTDTYQSWCAAHVPLKKESWQHLPEEQCAICYEEMGCYDKITSIRAPCCKNGWFHQQCVARFAQTAGYFFKCPLCNNVDTFTQEIPLRGVFVPERDAAWELEPNAFQDQLVRPNACDAQECKCTEGRETDNRHWKLLMCGSCGSTCRHRECLESAESRTYVCNLCQPIIGANVPELAVDDEDDDDDDDGDDVGDDVDDDDANDNDDEDEATSSMSSEDGKRLHAKDPSPGSEESGVQCSSSDESVLKPHRLQRKRIFIQSEPSDSEQSDTSSSIIRRCLMRNTGKRVRRVISEESEETDCKEDEQNSAGTKTDCVGEEPSDTASRSSVHEQVDENSNTSGTSSISIERAHTIHRRGTPAKRRWIDSPDEQENGTNCTKQLRGDRSPTASRKKPKKSSPKRTPVEKPTSSEDEARTKCTGRVRRNRSILGREKSRQSFASPTKIENLTSSDADKGANCTKQLKRNRSAIRRAASSFKESECTEPSKESDGPHTGGKKSPNSTTVGDTTSCDTDGSDDIPLSKRRFVEAKRCAKEEEKETVDVLNRSNEENIRPVHRQENKPLANQLTPPSASGATGGERDHSGDKPAGQGRLQHSILKFFTQSPRYTPAKTTSDNTDLAASSSSASSTRDGGNKRGSRGATNGIERNSKAVTAANEKPQDQKMAKMARKAVRRNRKSIVTKEKGQINLLNYFNRC